MKPKQGSQTLLSVTRAKAKMFEYNIDEKHHIEIRQDPAKLFTLAISILGDLSAASNRKQIKPEELAELRRTLIFSAHFFDAYLQSRLNEELDPYLILLSSASYYLCNLPGSSKVLANQISSEIYPNIEGEGLENLLLWLLKGDLATHIEGVDGQFGEYIDTISNLLIHFFKDGTNSDSLLKGSAALRQAVYDFGTPRQLLLGDVISAIVSEKHLNSSWYALPRYSGLTKDRWHEAIQKDSFIKELWPAQHLLGQKGILLGESAVVQMPTSAGKTKAIELIIRSAFLADRTSLAIIVAPFRALCHEIKDSLLMAFGDEEIKVDELSDVMQTDFEIAEFLANKQILVVTPEKLLYVLRHDPKLAACAGLVVFDEGHQFDSGTRGITYELLLTSLRTMLPKEAQKVLISAVISNAEAVGEWLNGANPVIVAGSNLVPTFRSIGFASWLDQLGTIYYVSNEDPEQREFFVPRVIENYELKRKKGESKTKVRRFPAKDVGKEIALYLGLKLIPQGAVAIFCGRKDTASGLCETIVERFSRELPLVEPAKYSNADELSKLYYLHLKNLGLEAPATRSAQLGIFSHHGNTPHGIRLAVEHAMREGLIHFVICTSTLAQGVNLPIRYLIVTSVYQGLERIKVRDFHNLIGRAGRAGIHTEGSILFADPVVYDKRKNWQEKWRWDQVKELLDPSKSEECVSSLFQLIPLVVHNDRSKAPDKKDSTVSVDILSFASAYIGGWDELTKVVKDIVQKYGQFGFTEERTNDQFEFFAQTLASIESFLMSQWDANESEISEEGVIHLAEETLAYFLADDKKREQIRDLFKLLANNISGNVTDSSRRKVYAKTLYGMRDDQELDNWMRDNVDKLSSANTEEDLLLAVWPVLQNHIHNGSFKKCNKPDILKEVSLLWIRGMPFDVLLDILHKNDARLGWGKRPLQFKIDHVVDICEGGLAYDGALLVGALIEFVNFIEPDEKDTLVLRLQLLQKRIKYGLPTETSIALYELGFSDRAISQDIASILNLRIVPRQRIIKAIKRHKNTIMDSMDRYPCYFSDQLSRILTDRNE
ncbi:MAG: DEAD/DEAH box helicase [Syntrophaceae bacterium]